MSTSSLPLAPERQKLMDAYHKLAAPERAVVNLLAVHWGGMNKTQIQTGLRKLVGADKIKSLKLDALTKSGLLLGMKEWNHQRLRCHPLIVELVARHLVVEGAFNSFVDLAHQAAPLQKSYLRYAQDEYIFRNEEELIREIRLGMYWRDEAYITGLVRMVETRSYGFYGIATEWLDPGSTYALVCSNPFDAEWFSGLPAGIRSIALPRTLSLLAGSWRCDEAARVMLLESCEKGDAPQAWRDMAINLAVFRGEFGEAEALLARSGINSSERSRRATLALLLGDVDAALNLYRDGLALLRKEQRSKKIYYTGVAGLLYILALHQRNAPGDMDEAQKLIIQVAEGSSLALAYALLACTGLLELNDQHGTAEFGRILAQVVNMPVPQPWVVWIAALLLCRYQGAAGLQAHLAILELCRRTAQNSGFAWLAAEVAALIGRVPGQDAAKQQALGFEAQAGIRLLASRIHYEEPWERALNAIANTVAKPAAKKEGKAEASETRLAWYVAKETHARYGYDVEVREQIRNAKGGWSKGKQVSLRRLRENLKDYAGATAQDGLIAKHIGVDYRDNVYYLGDKGWLALAGHPHLFWRNNGTALELTLAEPELRVKKKSKSDLVRIEFWPQVAEGDGKVVLTPDGLTRLKAIELKPEHLRLADIVGPGLEAPQAAQERILQSLSTVSSLVTIHSDIGGAELSAAETVEADSSPRVQLVPEGEGLRIALLVRPFGDQGPYYAPATGGAGLIAEIGGKRLQAQRNLKDERRLAEEILELCPSLGNHAEETEKWQWLAPDAESSLEVLLELHEIGGKAAVEWPQGQKFKMLGRADLGGLSLRLQQQRDWFSVNGELKLYTGEVLNMQRLLELTAGSKSKFIQLDENRFIALTESFRRRLDDLRSYSEKHGKEQRLNLLALPAIEEIAGEVGDFQADIAWRKQVEKLREAEQFQPKLPSTLQAELRDYQLEGFNWLSRLAAWGVGACLADDMGLGKTLQAIALILSRAEQGPCLVIAPTSVCFNWQNELARFAPTLNPRSFIGAPDRQQMVENLQAYDLLICSYGLLQQESVGELLASVKFNTIVLDEAQAIKNAATKRSQQAMALQGEFKLITTGTPVENHLGELWNLFRFINPGLLGSLESFNRRFAGPIERGEDRDAKHRLKRLIQPFILRRTKSQVLDELPPRTEIELQVELSDKEAAFYEALRRKLLDDINAQGGPIEDQRFKVLAAITKLRRACCNPSLVAPDLGMSSSKLDLFSEVLEELLENRHKALVFSQFVDHLGIIRTHLDSKGISYQYLDGQTPALDRKKRVEAFQAGQGDVFLISLKAGGVGLNLTAADYVIHMDPWWNPAVEDQASDRAHRIGQQRPVTVYRLVTKGTIEEQIVSLHRQKRDLADSLLEGGEISAKVGAAELLELMRSE